jgi:hypothetical protein
VPLFAPYYGMHALTHSCSRNSPNAPKSRNFQRSAN